MNLIDFEYYVFKKLQKREQEENAKLSKFYSTGDPNAELAEDLQVDQAGDPNKPPM